LGGTEFVLPEGEMAQLEEKFLSWFRVSAAATEWK